MLVAFMKEAPRISSLWWPFERHPLFHRWRPWPGGDLSAHLDRWLVTGSAMPGVSTLRSVGVIKNWLSFYFSSDSLDRFMEGLDDKDSKFWA